MDHKSRPRRFAPLDPGVQTGGDAMKLRGVIFDVDGTLCEPQNYMFAEMRDALGIPKSIDILDHIYALPSSEQEAAMGSIRVIESRAMVAQKPQPGLLKLMEYLDSQGIPKGICTRNFELPVTHLLTTFLPSHNFSPIVTRDFRPPKPDPAGLLHIASAWGLVSSSQRQASSEPPDLPIIMVGDSIDDMTAGHRAGAATVLLVNPANDHLGEHEHTDMCIARLDDLINILDEGFVA